MSSSDTDRSSAPGVLVVRLGAMGDILHALPAAASLKHNFPASPLTWVVESQWLPLLAGNPFIDRVVPLDRKSPRTWWRTRRELHTHRYALAVDFQGLLKSAMVASFARPDRIVGFHQSQVRERPAALFYSTRVASTSAHRVDRNLDLAAAAGASSRIHSFSLPPGRPEGTLPDSAFVLASPFSGWTSKQWPLEAYAELARRLRRELDLPLVLNGPPAARAELSSVPGAIVHTSSIDGLIDATRRSTAVVGVDSGPMHLAAALGKPGVAIFGPTDPAINGPYGESLLVIRQAGVKTTYQRGTEIDPSMRAVSAEQVLTALKAQVWCPAVT